MPLSLCGCTYLGQLPLEIYRRGLQAGPVGLLRLPVWQMAPVLWAVTTCPQLQSHHSPQCSFPGNDRWGRRSWFRTPSLEIKPVWRTHSQRHHLKVRPVQWWRHACFGEVQYVRWSRCSPSTPKSYSTTRQLRLKQNFCHMVAKPPFLDSQPDAESQPVFLSPGWAVPIPWVPSDGHSGCFTSSKAGGLLTCSHRWVRSSAGPRRLPHRWGPGLPASCHVIYLFSGTWSSGIQFPLWDCLIPTKQTAD